MSVHIERDGTRAVCDEDSCDLLIHLPVSIVEEANALPSNMLLALIEAADPPHDFDPLGRWRQWVMPGTKASEYCYHRDYDLPAVIFSDGSMTWFQNGHYHREGDKPAHVGADGTLMWWLNHKVHRENDQPAKIQSDGTREWYAYSSRHREGDKPAIVYPNGSVEYWQNGERHRWRGPAVIDADGTTQWYWRGLRVASPLELIMQWWQVIRKKQPA